MYLLDTDVLSLFFRRKGQQPYLEERILAIPIENLLISIISFDEAMNGIRALIDNLPSNSAGKKYNGRENLDTETGKNKLD